MGAALLPWYMCVCVHVTSYMFTGCIVCSLVILIYVQPGALSIKYKKCPPGISIYMHGMLWSTPCRCIAMSTCAVGLIKKFYKYPENLFIIYL